MAAGDLYITTKETVVIDGPLAGSLASPDALAGSVAAQQLAGTLASSSLTGAVATPSTLAGAVSGAALEGEI